MTFFTVTLFLCFANTVTSAPTTNSTNGDATPCLTEFYEAAYDLEFDCTESYDFFSNDLTAQHNAFKIGKDCFLQVAKAKCTPAEYKTISSKYDDFLSVLTIKPANDDECTSSYYKYNSLRCQPMLKQFGMDTLKFALAQVDQNDAGLLEFLDLCDETAECVASGCNSTDVVSNGIKETCDGMELKNSAFFVCTMKIEKERPDMSGYKCLGGTNYYDPSLEVTTELVTTKKMCTKEIYETICGKAALYNFDKFAEMSLEGALKNAQAKQLLQQVLNEK